MTALEYVAWRVHVLLRLAADVECPVEWVTGLNLWEGYPWVALWSEEDLELELDRFQVEVDHYHWGDCYFVVDTARPLDDGVGFTAVDWSERPLTALILASARSAAHRRLRGRRPTLDWRALSCVGSG